MIHSRAETFSSHCVEIYCIIVIITLLHRIMYAQLIKRVLITSGNYSFSR